MITRECGKIFENDSSIEMDSTDSTDPKERNGRVSIRYAFDVIVAHLLSIVCFSNSKNHK
jgi:hypothetical protein